MKSFVIISIAAVIMLAAVVFVAHEVRRIWRDRKKRRELKLQEAKRRSEIKSGVVSEDAFRRQVAFQAAMLHANSYFAEAFATLAIGFMCGFLAALLHLLGPRFMEPLSWMLVCEFLVIGLVILTISFVDLIDFKFFQRDLSSEYRALLDVERPSEDEE